MSWQTTSVLFLHCAVSKQEVSQNLDSTDYEVDIGSVLKTHRAYKTSFEMLRLNKEVDVVKSMHNYLQKMSIRGRIWCRKPEGLEHQLFALIAGFEPVGKEWVYNQHTELEDVKQAARDRVLRLSIFLSICHDLSNFHRDSTRLGEATEDGMKQIRPVAHRNQNRRTEHDRRFQHMEKPRNVPLDYAPFWLSLYQKKSGILDNLGAQK